MANKKLTESAANLGDTATKRAKRATKKEEQPTPTNENENPLDSFSSDSEDDRKAGRKMISAWVDAAVWDDICQLARYRAAKGIKNHLGQGMSAGRLLEAALIAYVDANRDELDRWKAFIDSEK